MDMDFLCSDYYNLFDSLEEWNGLGSKYEIKENGMPTSGLIKFGEILYNETSTSLIYICELCHKSLQDISTFQEHIKCVHDFNTNKEIETSQIDPPKVDSERNNPTDLNASSQIESAKSETKVETATKEDYVVIPVSSLKYEADSLPMACSPNIKEIVEEDFNQKRARSPSIMRKINKDPRPIDFISNPWHCECGRIVPITHKYQHMKSHNDVPIFECQITGCFDIFFRQSELDEHYDLIHNSEDPKKPFSCQFCQRHFSNKKNYSTHVKRIHLSDPRHHTCPHCHYYFYSKSYLQQHIHKKHSEMISKNEDESNIVEANDTYFQYENNFPSEEYYSDNEDMMQTNDEHLCKFCNAIFPCNEDLLSHMEKAHNVKEISLCRVCGCDINSDLHKRNCLRRVNVAETDTFADADSMSIITYDINESAQVDNDCAEEEDLPDDEMDFLKFLNVDFDR